MPRPSVLVVDADPALLGLIGEWLGAQGYDVVGDETGGSLGAGFKLVVVDVPFPRRGGREALEQLAKAHRGTPILALSASFHPGVEVDGAVARSLGASAVLPKPVVREALCAAARRLLTNT